MCSKRQICTITRLLVTRGGRILIVSVSPRRELAPTGNHEEAVSNQIKRLEPRLLANVAAGTHSEMRILQRQKGTARWAARVSSAVLVNRITNRLDAFLPCVATLHTRTNLCKTSSRCH